MSVILPVYNAANYLKEAIDSILSQDYANFELLIINDGSTDTSESIIFSYTDSRIVYIKNEKNLQLIATLNKGLSVAKGDYIARMDADDLSNSSRFSKQVAFMETHQEYGIVGSRVETIGSLQKVIAYPESDEEIRYSMLFYNPFVHSSVLLRKSILDTNHLLYDPAWLHVEDFDLWIRVLQFSKGANLSDVLVQYRFHHEQISSKHFELQLQNTKKLRQDYYVSLLFPISDVSKYVHLFSEESETTIDFNIQLLEKTRNISNFKGLGKNAERFKNFVIKKCKDNILRFERIERQKIILILKNFNFFTFKQLLSLFKKTLV